MKKKIVDKVAVILLDDGYWKNMKKGADQGFRFDPEIAAFVKKYSSLKKDWQKDTNRNYEKLEVFCSKFEKFFEEKYGWKPPWLDWLKVEYVAKGTTFSIHYSSEYGESIDTEIFKV